MNGVCMTCGAVGRVDEHHIAGERHDSVTKVLICVPDHQYVTSSQYVSGVVRKGAPPAGFIDGLIGTLLGMGVLLELHLRQLEQHPMADRVRLYSRYVSIVLDLLGPPDRTGRVTPNPKSRQFRLTRRRSEALAQGKVTPGFLSNWDHIITTSPVLAEADDRITRAVDKFVAAHPRLLHDATRLAIWAFVGWRLGPWAVENSVVSNERPLVLV